MCMEPWMQWETLLFMKIICIYAFRSFVKTYIALSKIASFFFLLSSFFFLFFYESLPFNFFFFLSLLILITNLYKPPSENLQKGIDVLKLIKLSWYYLSGFNIIFHTWANIQTTTLQKRKKERNPFFNLLLIYIST